MMKANHAYCALCDILFDSENALRDHRRDTTVHRTSKESSQDLPQCRLCRRNFDDQQALKMHIQNAPHSCQPCNRQFGSWKMMCRHLVDPQSPHFWCFECWKELESEAELVQHYKLRHVGTRAQCPACHDVLDSPLYIPSHILKDCVAYNS
ncbi:hypothetical protein C8F01DRAFT_1102054 [Mycena amicta]|nr:hypothetical protein C8F01DRAFT_1102054 [Mycena amicta]